MTAADDMGGLLGALTGAPRLPGARCVGRSALFDSIEPGEDPEAADERVEAAKHICGTCRALPDCDEWVMSLARSRRPPGVTGGVYRDHPSDAKRRRKRSAA